jgi:aryl-phospho-beta-D-glucosidase BglC (GH1 family)
MLSFYLQKKPESFSLIALIFCFSFFMLFACKKTGTQTPDPVPVLPLSAPAALAKGINLSNWFNDYSDVNQFGNRFTPAHFAKLKQSGFTYVRIPIGHTILFQENTPSVLNPVNLTYVDNAVQNAINAGLAVTINYHTAQDTYEQQMTANTVLQDKLAAYWKAVAGYFKKYDTAKMFFEVYNEPHVASNGSTPGLTKAWWEPVQKKLIDAVREATAAHYIIAGGEGWNAIDGLVLLTPYNVSKVIYNFHFYDPFVFTHQGASWIGPPISTLSGVPYPSTPANVAALVTAATDNDTKNLLTWYGDQQFNYTKLNNAVAVAYTWAKQNKAALICNEFGSYKPNAPASSRLSWIKNIRTSLESYGIGWAMWEMDEGFGFINYPGSSRTIFTTDDAVLQSLGLK